MGPKKRILINDDEPALVESLAHVFGDAGYQVVTSLHCREAVRMIDEFRPDLVITDLHMPEFTGFQLIDELSRLDRLIPVIAMSGQVGPPTGPVPFISKPFSPRELVRFISEHIDELTDLQLLKRLAQSTGIPETSLGKVLVFNPAQGWGLLRVIGQDSPLYVNAADLVASRNPGKIFQFAEVWPGQVVRFRLDAAAPRGARARDVEVVYESIPRKCR